MGFHIILIYEVGLVFDGSELNISPRISGDNNKGGYISSEKVLIYMK